MASAVPPEEIPTGHTSSDQWQSFEMRMRQRRIDRLVVRADAALEAGSVEEARAAIEELERLSQHATELDRLRPRFAQALERSTARASAERMQPMPPVPPATVPVVEGAAVTPVSTPPRIEALPFKPAEPPEPAIVAPAAVEPAPVTPSPTTAPAGRPVIVKPPIAPAIVKPAVVKPAAVAKPAAVVKPAVAKPAAVVNPAVVKPAVVKPVVATPPPDVVKPPAVAAPPSPLVAPRAPAALDTADEPAAAALLRVEAAPTEDSSTSSSEPVHRRGRRWAQVAAAMLIGASIGWLAVTRAPWIQGGAPASASAPAATAPAPAVDVTPSEPASALAAPPAVDVAVTDITPAESPAPGPEAEGRTPEPATAALVGERIPTTQPTTAAAVSTTPPAVLPAPVEPPSEPPSSAPVPAVTLASTPVPERAPEPLPEPPPAPVAAASAEPVASAPTAAATAPAVPAVPDEARIRMTLGRYEAAYSNLDVNAAGAVWPGLDKRALARAFDGLTSQRVDLGNCDVRVAGETAVAECAGTAAWTPKVGGGTHRQARRWQFRLRSEGGGWQIVSANVR